MLRQTFTSVARAFSAPRGPFAAAFIRFVEVAAALAIVFIALAWTGWFLAAVVPIFLIYQFLGQRQNLHTNRLRHGLCPTCGYDLRASNDLCPECGSPVPSSDKEQITTNNSQQS